MVSAGLHGIGRSISYALNRQQYAVSASTTRADAEVPNVYPYVWQPADSAAGVQWVDAVLAQWGRIDVLINNMGPYLWDYPALVNTDETSWNFIVQTNLTMSFQLAKAVIPHMRRQGGGTIINIGCVGAARAAGWTFRGAYAAAKSALASLTRTIAAEEQSYGISCAMICPSDVRGGEKERADEDLASRRRLPSGADVARLVAFLIEPESFYLSGNILELAPPLDRYPLQVGDTVLIAPLGMDGRIEEIKQEQEYPLYRVQPAAGHAAWYMRPQLQRVEPSN